MRKVIVAVFVALALAFAFVPTTAYAGDSGAVETCWVYGSTTYCYSTYELGPWTAYKVTWSGPCGSGWQITRVRPIPNGSWLWRSKTGGVDPNCN